MAKKIGVIGGGPAGMTAAYKLAKGGHVAHVYEAGPSAGGMAKTIDLWGHRVDLGPHRFFSSDRRVNELWLEVMGGDYEIVDRLTRIIYKGKFYSYPLSPGNALRNLGVFEAGRCVLSYAREKLFPSQADGSFESWVTGRFGKRLFEIFFKSYSEKLWGISCRELDADFAAQRIKKLSLFEAVKNAFFGSRAGTHKTLVDQFAYPVGGTGVVYERMADYVDGHAGKVFYNCPVQGLWVENGRVKGLELKSGDKVEYDHVVSTMPLTLLVSRLPDVPVDVRAAADSLKFRNTILVYLNVPLKDLFPDQWIYVHSPELKTGRVTNFKNWSAKEKDSDGGVIVMEYWCYDEDPMWSEPDGQLAERAKRELKSIGIKAARFLTEEKMKLVREGLLKKEFVDTFLEQIRDFKIKDSYVHRIKRCYPVYAKGYKAKVKAIEAYLDTIRNISVIGRYGAFKYNNQDHSILMGLLAADNIMNGAGHDLWSINTDYENYQETALITKTGLVIKENKK